MSPEQFNALADEHQRFHGQGGNDSKKSQCDLLRSVGVTRKAAPATTATPERKEVESTDGR